MNGVSHMVGTLLPLKDFPNKPSGSPSVGATPSTSAAGDVQAGPSAVVAQQGSHAHTEIPALHIRRADSALIEVASGEIDE